jgi:hypothetical protein
MRERKRHAEGARPDVAGENKTRQSNGPSYDRVFGQAKVPVVQTFPRVIRCGKDREFYQIVDDVSAVIVARGEILNRDRELLYQGEILKPAALRRYLATYCLFDNGRKKINPPWPIVHAILAYAGTARLPVADAP